MGTQQILLIVLSVIIVGIAVAVGITMFNQNSVNNNRQAALSDMNYLANQVYAWYKTPISMGGAGHDMAEVTKEKLEDHLGENSLNNDNAEYFIKVVTADSTVIFDSECREGAIEPDPQVKISLFNGSITAFPEGGGGF